MVVYQKFSAKLVSSFQQILRVLQLNLFVKRDLIELFKPPEKQPVVSPQKMIWENL
jgi:hypothetical protein